jgi:predicted enzyme related to lactoylglutathione lyase
MHRSRVYAVLIDTPRETADEVTAFWSKALGVTPKPIPSEPQFIGLPNAVPGLVTAIQATETADDTPRVHIDIETDDIEAEIARLQALGAVHEAQWQECHTLRAPGGHVFCVLSVESDPAEFAATANTWE